MSEIFISYKSSDKARVKILVEALERQGWSVWWDREIPPGKTFDEVIEEALNAAKCVIVVWSKESVVSDWVKTEASEGARRGVLVPVLIDDAKIPLEFRRIQAAWLVGWDGNLPHPGFEQLAEAVAAILGHFPTQDQAAEVWKREEAESLDKKGKDKNEGKPQEEEPHPQYQEKLEATPERRIPAEIKTGKWYKIAMGVGIVALVILGIFAYKLLLSADVPKITLLTASAEFIKAGEKVTLSWETSDAKEVEIIGVGKVPLSGTETVSPTETTTYTLIAENEKGNAVRRKVTVKVKMPLPQPAISYFKASPTSIKKGESSSLSWETSNAKEVEISGLGKVSLSGTERVSPSETTAYTLIATNEEGESVQTEATVEVKVAIPRPKIDYFVARPPIIERGERTTLRWQTTNANQVSLRDLGRVELSGSKIVAPAATTNYFLIAKNDGGDIEHVVTVVVNIPRATLEPAGPQNRDMIQNPQRYIRIHDFSFFVAPNGVGVVHHLKIENTGDVMYKDVKVKVRYYSSGTEVSSSIKVLPITLRPRNTATYLGDGFVLGAAPNGVIDGKIEVLGAVAVE